MLPRVTPVFHLALSCVCLGVFAGTLNEAEHATHEHTGMSNIPLSVCRSTGFCSDFKSMEKMMFRMLNSLTSGPKPEPSPVLRYGIEDRPLLKGEPGRKDSFAGQGHLKGEQGLEGPPPPNFNRVASTYSNRPTHDAPSGSDLIEKSAPPNSKVLPNAGCALYDQVVELTNTEPNSVIYPSCVVVKRCGGCAVHSSLACRPNATERVPVMVTQYVFNGEMTLTNITYMKVKNHTSCQEECRVVESDCDKSIQYYDAAECECRCNDNQGPASCTAGKIWDTKTCSCICHHVVDCGDGYIFDSNTCRCLPVIQKSGYSYIQGGLTNVANADRIPVRVVDPLIINTTPDPCAHMSCKFRGPKYQAMIIDGRCRCQYVRTSSHTNQ